MKVSINKKVVVKNKEHRNLQTKNVEILKNRVTNSNRSIPQKIMIIGELGGGTKYFSEKALCGLYYDLKNRKVENIPDYLIILGSILPEIPKYATKGPADKLHVIEDGINNLDDAVIAVKSNLERVISTLKKGNSKTKVYYVIGTEDRANIKNRNYDRLINAYNNSPEMLKELKDAYIKKIEINRTIVSKMKENVKNLKYTAKMDEDISLSMEKRYKKKVADLKLKISQITDQLKDYRVIVQTYERLQINWIRENPHSKLIKKDFVKEVFGEDNKWNNRLYKEQIKYIIDEYSKVVQILQYMNKEENNEKYEKEEAKVKKLANLLDALGYKNISDIKKKADLTSSIGGVREKGELFTRNLRASHDVEEIAREIANLEIISHIKDAFGRKYPINIIQDKDNPNIHSDLPLYGIIPSKQFNILIMNNPSNTSNLFKNNVNRVVERMLNLQHVEGFGKIRLIIGGHSAEARVKAMPIVDGGRGAFMILTPPFIDTTVLSDLWKSNTKTPYTMMYEKSNFKPASGIWEVVFDLPRNKFTYLPLENFVQLSEKEYEEQRKILVRKLLSFHPNGKWQKNELIKNLKEEFGVADRIMLKHKLPSEWNGELIKDFLIINNIRLSDKGSIDALARAIKLDSKNVAANIKKAFDYVNHILPINTALAKNDKKEKLITFSCISDAHIGNSGAGLYAPQELMDAFIRKIVDEPSDVIIYGGDNLDANYKNYAFEIMQNTDYISNSSRFLEFISDKLPKDQIKTAMDRYINRTVKQVINIENQLRIFIKSVRVLENIPNNKKPDQWVVSGNHYNKSGVNRDEAILESVAFDITNDRVTIVPGGDQGLGYGIKDDEFFMLRHDINKKIFDGLRSGMNVRGVFAGHKHEFDFEIIGNKFIARAPSPAYINAYPQQIGIPTSEELRGFSRYSILLRREEPVSFTAEFVTQGWLEDEGYLDSENKVDQLIHKFNKLMNPATASEIIVSDGAKPKLRM